MTKKNKNGGGGGEIKKSEKKRKARPSSKRVVRADVGAVVAHENLIVKKNERVVIDTKGKGRLTVNKITLQSGGTLSCAGGDFELVPVKKTFN